MTKRGTEDLENTDGELESSPFSISTRVSMVLPDYQKERLQAFVHYNMAMVGGLVPFKGFPLPLMSYGGSSMMTTLIGFGLTLNVRMRRFVN